jgi:formamidopyrimidine-DNA glycosylase
LPELPEVEFARGCLERWWRGRTLDHVSAPPTRLLRGSSPAAFARLSGHRVETVERRGKWLHIRLSEGAGLLAHLGMTGKFVRVRGEEPVRWSRATFVDDRGFAVHARDPRMFGRLVPGRSDELVSRPEWTALGPDAWLEPPAPRPLSDLLSRSRRSVKEQLLDQALLAGLGNIQATEALFFARIDPRRPGGSLSAAEAARLVEGIHRTLARTLALNAGDDIAYVEEGGENPFVVYGRAGTPCPVCGEALASLVQSGRATVFCRRCQA